MAASVVTSLHGNAVAEAQGTRLAAGADAEVQQAGAAARNRGKRTELTTGALGRGDGHIKQPQAGAVGEDHVSPHRIGGRVGGGGGEEEAIAAEGLIHHEIGVPVGAAQQTTGPHPLAHYRIAAAAQGQQERAAGLGPGARRLTKVRAAPRARPAAAGRRDLGWAKAMEPPVRAKRPADRKPITG